MNPAKHPGDEFAAEFFGEPLAPATGPAPRQSATMPLSGAPLPALIPEGIPETCTACGGTGQWRGRGRCFKCEGRGKRYFKTSAATRQAKVRAAHNRKERVYGEYAAAHPTEFAWLLAGAARGNDFAVSLLTAAKKFGSLTDGQLAAVGRNIASDEARKIERAAREAAAPAVAIGAIATAFARAAAAGLRRIKVRLDSFTFKPASASGKYPGSIYVTLGDEYMGRVTDGRFVGVRACTPEYEARIIAACADPAAAAKAYGQRTGECSCCGRELTDPVSIAAGIGPICAGRFGF